MTLRGEDFPKALAPTGKLRLGVYPGSPFSLMRDPATGEAIGVAAVVMESAPCQQGVPVSFRFAPGGQIFRALTRPAAALHWTKK